MRTFRIAMILTALVFMFGCQLCRKGDNLENSEQLRVGMTKANVLELMGEPLTDEAYATPNVWFYYITTKWYDGLTTRDECMPLVFEDGKLAGWGNEYYNRLHIEGNYPE